MKQSISFKKTKSNDPHCVKSVRIRNYFSLHFPAFGLNTERYSVSLRISPYSVRMRENVDQNNAKYQQFLRSATMAESIISTYLTNQYLCPEKDILKMLGANGQTQMAECNVLNLTQRIQCQWFRESMICIIVL